MKKLWKLLEETQDKLVYKWNGPKGKGTKFTVFRGEFNSWYAVQAEGSIFVDFSVLQAEGKIYHLTQVAKIIGLE